MSDTKTTQVFRPLLAHRDTLLALAALSAACSAAGAGDGTALATSSASTVASASPQPSEQTSAKVAACIAAAEAIPSGAEAPAAMWAVTNGCLPLYSEKGCRDAQLRAILPETDPSQRIRILSDGCAEAYCPLINPKPGYCTMAPDTALLEWLKLATELKRAILLHELGEEQGQALFAGLDRAAARREAER